MKWARRTRDVWLDYWGTSRAAMKLVPLSWRELFRRSAMLQNRRELTSTEWYRHLSILPQFHRTHVTSHACCLLLAYALNPPSSSPTSPSPSSSLADMPGLGLRRAQWFSNALNKPSITCALRLGFVLEAAEMKWERVLPPSKEGLPLPSWALEREVEAGRGVRSGRHSTLLGLDWELWLSGGGRQNAQGLVRREVRRRVFSP